MKVARTKRAGSVAVASVVDRPANGAKRPQSAQVDERFRRRLNEILDEATDVFYEKGYEGASMRDLSKATGMSLAGLYHYFESKEKVLFMIQKHTFETVVQNLRVRLESVQDPIERVKVFIANHLEYFLANMKAMKVLSHEDEVLKGEYGEQVQAIKREYYRICLSLVEDARDAAGFEVAVEAPRGGRKSGKRESDRTAVMALFGMLNWLYTWYNARVDGDAGELSQQMSAIFLAGIFGGANAGAGAMRSARSKA